jgi:16S rRNA (uracil1498-N3)-methyltransferase
MALPLFYHDGALEQLSEIQLEEDTARHIVQVLRMHLGEYVQLTNGKGYLAKVMIMKAEKKKCTVRIESVAFTEPAPVPLHLCIAFTKNTSRNEWLLEKATELGVKTIIPIISARTEKQHIKRERWNNILIAAIIQSQQLYVPELTEPLPLSNILQRLNDVEQKLVGHCIDSEPRRPLSEIMAKGKDTVILIGPEGDFTQDEVNMCKENGFLGISLGAHRLRTETAAMAACSYFNMVNYEA